MNDEIMEMLNEIVAVAKELTDEAGKIRKSLDVIYRCDQSINMMVTKVDSAMMKSEIKSLNSHTKDV